MISIKKVEKILKKQPEIAKCSGKVNSPPFIDFSQSEGAARGLGLIET